MNHVSNGNASVILGCSAFGLDDMVVSPDSGMNREVDFFPASVVLPGRPYGPILAGRRAKLSRVHSGLPWPPEAWVKAGEYLRRVPVCCAWRAMVEARDSQTRWEVGGGVSFPLSKILAAHIAELLVPQEQEVNDQVTAALAISDDLDEYGQHNLLVDLQRELDERSVHGDVRLLWRPVAVALAWLAKARDDKLRRIVEKDPDDFLLVLYLGADAIECVTLQMRVRTDKKGLDHIVPRRERPKDISALAGYGWVGRVIEKLPQVGHESYGAFWQAFISFPEIWGMLAGKSLREDDLPRIWGLENGYDFWAPDGKVVPDIIEKVRCGPSEQLLRLLKTSCVMRGSFPDNCSWPERLTLLVRETVKSHPAGRMVGMAVCGPLAPPDPPSWLSACFPDLEARGLDTSGPWNTREANRLWLSPGSAAIAKGTAIFQQKLQNQEPTYLDSLPQYFLLVREKGGYTTFPLVDEQDVEGGDEYSNKIEQKFAIEGNSNKLDVVIVRHGRHEALLKTASSVERLDSEVGRKVEGLSMAEASLVRHLIRTAVDCDSALQRVRRNARKIGNPGAALYYGNFYAQVWHKTEEGQRPLLPPEPQTIQTSETPFRLLTFPFPVPSPKTMPVDIHVRIRPASGMAHLEVKPEDSSFLYGRAVFADYRAMRPCRPEELELDIRGWPPLEELAPHPEPALYDGIDTLVASFERDRPRTDSFKKHLEKIYNLLKTRKFYDVLGAAIYLPVLNQDGQAGCQRGDELVSRFSRALQNHAAALRNWDDNQIGKLITRATWLYGATPEAVIVRIREYIQLGRATARTIEAGSRALRETRDMRSFFDFISWKIETEQRFVIQNIRACTNVLSLRGNGQDGLNERTAGILLEGVMMEIERFAGQNHYERKFFAGLRLLLYLLRYRKRDERFLPLDSEKSNFIKEKLTSFLPRMKRCMSNNRYHKADQIMKGIVEYLDFAGSTGFLNTLTEFSGSDFENGPD